MLAERKFIMVKVKRIMAAIMATIALTSTGLSSTMSASASNTTNVNYSINISSNISTKTADSNSQQLKQDDKSTYINYNSLKNGGSVSGPTKFRVYVFGSATSNGTYVDCSSYKSDGTARPAAIITKGTKGYVKQLVYETFGYNSYAKLYGQRYKVGNTTYGYGTTTGCWSPDSVYESGTIEYN